MDDKVVDQESSCLGLEHEILIPLDATHRQICKYESPSDPLYILVLAEIKRCLENSSSKNALSKATPSLDIKAGKL